MKKEQFRTMVKEIIKEVISEIEQPVEEAGKQHSQYPKGDAEASSDQKTASRNDAWKSWGDKMKKLKGIHDEPEFKEKLKGLRKSQFEEP